MNDRLSAQIEFLKRADMLKTVERANVLLDQSRPENSAGTQLASGIVGHGDGPSGRARCVD